MRRVLAILVVAALVVAAAWWLASLRGHVAIQLGNLSVEMATPVFALGLLALVLLGWGFLNGFGLLVTLPRRLRNARARRARRLGDVAVTRALVALAAADKAAARRESARARRYLGDTPQTLFLASQAARLAGLEGEAEALFRTLAARDDAPLLGLRGLLQQAVAREDWAEAAALARRAEETYPGAAWLREERLRLAIHRGAWREALALAGPEAPRAVYAAAAAQTEPDPDEAIRLARQAWKDDPTLAPAALVYAERLRASGRESRAQGVLRDSWQAAPHPELASAALSGIDDPLQRLKAAERLVAGNPDHPESHLLLARCALAAGLPGEARRHAETARERLNERRLWILLADIEEAEHGPTEAMRDALRRAAMADPDPAWRCAACGTSFPAWHAVCPNCGTPGRVAWEAAVKVPLTETSG
ncbi:MAG: heme biosynthesis protein HemY [Alphaproteobacteria bacterium]|nr:heme biosynthesis protein HemY [Alphaproteobacteria bacterium]